MSSKTRGAASKKCVKNFISQTCTFFSIFCENRLDVFQNSRLRLEEIELKIYNFLVKITMSHKFFCAFNPTGTTKSPTPTIFIDLKESSLNDELRSSFDWMKVRVEKYDPDLPLTKLSKSVKVPSAVEQYVWQRVYATLDESNITAPMNDFHDGSSEIKRINGKNKHKLKPAILSYLRGKEAILTLHASHPVDTSSEWGEADPVFDQASVDSEMDTEPGPQLRPVEPEPEQLCSNESCANRIRALELEVQRLKKELMKSRKRLKVTS